MTRYCVYNEDLALYYVDGHWGEEPEWFSAAEATAIMRRLQRSTDDTITCDFHEFESEE